MSQLRSQFATLIADRLGGSKDEFARKWQQSHPVRHVVVDELLPADLASRISACFPPSSDLSLKSSLRERKRTGVHLEKYDPIIADALYAFQAPIVVGAIGQITAIPGLMADPSFYAGGISVMQQDDFLNPHIDNSHDGDQHAYRVLNLLYYVAPEWREEFGGHLELWDAKVRNPLRVSCRFNRLVIMETNLTSWHSVCQITHIAERQCVSNYYFADAPPNGIPYRHVTTFTGRPDQPIRRVALAVIDGVMLNTAGRLFPWLIKRNSHRRKVAK
jgi:Rps23 Pro-64 3,4-dihydroxylase Tpa1-like proline 4-hydroxylase